MSLRFRLAILCVFMRVVHGGSPIARDWTNFPAVVQVDAKSDIYAIGDAHSDYARLARLVRAAGLVEVIPAKSSDAVWTGKRMRF